jgi:alpha-tubulin suppressor-like RCC1 family protein
LGQPGVTAAGLTPGDLAALAPVEIGSGRTVKSIAVGPLHACAVLNLGELKCWGGNGEGQLGLGTPVDNVDQKPRDVSPVYLGGVTAKQVAAGERHTCALLDNGTVKCWGLNASGQLGLGDSNSRGTSDGQLGADTTVDLRF